MKELVKLIGGIGWIAGFVLSKGFWPTVACVIPFWAWYTTIEFLLGKL